MIVHELDTFPVQYADILVFPEYFTSYTPNKAGFHRKFSKYKNEDINYYVIGVGRSYTSNNTTILLLNKSFEVIGVRHKISIFWQEPTKPSNKLEAFDISKNRRIGVVVCKEILHTAIAEVYRMMKVNLVTVSIGSGDFWGMQRESWIDQMTLFSDICQAPLVCVSGATKEEGGINLIIER
jgi:predicted amidohydrolase